MGRELMCKIVNNVIYNVNDVILPYIILSLLDTSETTGA